MEVFDNQMYKFEAMDLIKIELNGCSELDEKDTEDILRMVMSFDSSNRRKVFVEVIKLLIQSPSFLKFISVRMGIKEDVK